MRYVRRPLPPSLRQRVFERDDYTCRYCGHRPAALQEVVPCGWVIRWRATLHVDHVIPVAAGGMNVLTNLATACADCNLAKGSKVIPANVAYVGRLEREQADANAASWAAAIEDGHYAGVDVGDIDRHWLNI